jgi:hypothetical protein
MDAPGRKKRAERTSRAGLGWQGAARKGHWRAPARVPGCLAEVAQLRAAVGAVPKLAAVAAALARPSGGWRSAGLALRPGAAGALCCSSVVAAARRRCCVLHAWRAPCTQQAHPVSSLTKPLTFHDNIPLPEVTSDMQQTPAGMALWAAGRLSRAFNACTAEGGRAARGWGRTGLAPAALSRLRRRGPCGACARLGRRLAPAGVG